MADKKVWSCERFRKKIDAEIRSPRTYTQCDDSFRQSLTENSGQLMLVRASLFNSFFPGLAIACIFNACSHPHDAINALHLIWRLKAISVAAMLEHMDQLFGKRARPRIRPLGTFDVNDILMLVAAGNVLGSKDAAAFFWNKASFLIEADSLRVERSAFSAGPVEPFLFNLCARLYGNTKLLAIPDLASAQVFVDIEQNCETATFDSAADELLALKRRKLLAKGLDNDLVFGLNSYVNFFVPFEYLFLSHVRKETGFAMKESDDELLNLPVCKAIPFLAETGCNSHIQELIKAIRELLPDFSLPWEDRLQSLPTSEFQSVIVE